MKKLSKAINILLSIGLITIAIAVAYIAFPQFGNQALIVRSGSMSPNIPVGAIVVARPKDAYRVGDVLTFRSPASPKTASRGREKNSDTIITHRIVGVEPLKDGEVVYKTKGDANEEEDAWTVAQNQVIGKVNFTIPYAGQFLTFVKSDKGFFTMILIPAVFVMLIEAWNIVKEVRKRRPPAQRASGPEGKLNIDKPFDGFGFNNTFITGGKINKVGPSSRTNQGRTLVLKLLIPFILIVSLVVPGTYALLSDTETSTGNIFQAADDFSLTPTPNPLIDEPPLTTQSFSVEPTQTLNIDQPALEVSEEPTPTPTKEVSPSPSPSPEPEQIIEPTAEPEATP